MKSYQSREDTSGEPNEMISQDILQQSLQLMSASINLQLSNNFLTYFTLKYEKPKDY